MVKTPKKTIEHPEEDGLAQLIFDQLNKLDKNAPVAYFLDGSQDTPSDFTDFISTGDSMLDLAISNRPHGGIAVGRITELTGLEASGKSLVCMHLIKDTQRRGGVGVYIDTENAINEDFARAIGVELTGPNKMLVVPANTVEKIFEYVEKIIESVRSKNNDRLVTIIVDSVAAASTEQEMESDYGKDGYATGKAIIISKALRKITGLIGKQRVTLVFTNQLRMKMNAMSFSDPYTTSGGKGIGFHSSTRIRFSLAGQIKNSHKDVIGIKAKAHVTKNRLGPPHRKTEFEIYFDRGIDDHKSWLNTMEVHELIKKAGSYYTYTDENGVTHKFMAKEFPAFLAEDPVRKEKIYMDICNAYIMRYNSADLDPEDMIVDEEYADE